MQDIVSIPQAAWLIYFCIYFWLASRQFITDCILIKLTQLLGATCLSKVLKCWTDWRNWGKATKLISAYQSVLQSWDAIALYTQYWTARRLGNEIATKLQCYLIDMLHSSALKEVTPEPVHDKLNIVIFKWGVQNHIGLTHQNFIFDVIVVFNQNLDHLFGGKVV